MNITELIISQATDTGAIRYNLDLFDTVPIEVTESINDVQNIAERKAGFTKTIRLPGTHNNNDIFSNIFNVARSTVNSTETNFSPDFNPSLKADCTLYKDGIPQLSGYLQLTDITLLDDYSVEYEVVLIGRVANLFQDIAGLKMSDINLSEFDHTWNRTNIENSWSAPIGDGYYYGLINYGLTTSLSFYIDQMYPQVYVKTIIDKLFEQAGYRYQSDFFESDFFKRLVVPYSGKAFVRTAAEVTDRSYHAGCTTSTPIYIAPAGGGGVFKLPYNVTVVDSTPSGYNPSTYEFEVQGSGNYAFAVSAILELTNTNASPVNLGSYPIKATFIKNGTAFDSIIVYNGTIAGSTTITRTTLRTTAPIYCNDLDNVWVELSIGGSVNTNIQYSLLEGSTFFNITQAAIVEGDLMQLSKMLPNDINQTDFMTSIIKCFNLYSEPDKLDNKKLIIEPRDAFYTSTIVDLTEQVDKSKEEVLTPLGALQYKSYRYNWTADSDLQNKKITDKYTDPYGTRRFEIINDFVKDEYTQEVIFAPTPLSNALDTVLSDIQFKDSTGARVDSPAKIRLLTINEAVAFNKDWLLVSRGGAGVQYPQIPYVGHLDDYNSPTIDLNWGIPSEVFYTATEYTDRNLFNLFHKKGLEEITDFDSKIYECYVKMSPLGLSKLSFRDYYLIDKSYYRLYELNYSSTDNETVRLKFLKTKNNPAFVGTIGDVNGGISTIGNEPTPKYNIDPIRNGNYYNTSMDAVVMGSDNQLSADATLVNGHRNIVSANGVSVIGGADNFITNSGVTLIGSSGYESQRDGQSVVNNIDQSIGISVIMDASAVAALHTTPFEIIPIHEGYWTELYEIYATLYYSGGAVGDKIATDLQVNYTTSTTNIGRISGTELMASTSKFVRGVLMDNKATEMDSISIETVSSVGSIGDGVIKIDVHYRLIPILE